MEEHPSTRVMTGIFHSYVVISFLMGLANAIFSFADWNNWILMGPGLFILFSLYVMHLIRQSVADAILHDVAPVLHTLLIGALDLQRDRENQKDKTEANDNA